MRVKYLLLSFFLFVNFFAFGQKISGLIIDKTGRKPISGALVHTEKIVKRTDVLGRFEIDIPGTVDSIKITAIDYKTLFLTPKSNQFLTIQLEPKVTNLNEVSIHGKRDFKQDSLINRQAFAKQFNYTGPKVMDAFTGNLNKGTGELISINPLILIEALTKKSSPEYKFKQRLIKDEHEQFVDEHFNRGIVVKLTSMKGDTLSEFLTRFRPDFLFTQKATGYDMEVYIKDCFKKFEKEGFPVSKLFYEERSKEENQISLY